MDAQLKERWIEALTSGRYDQGHHALREDYGSSYGYCCLGVLADLIDPNGWHEGVDKPMWDGVAISMMLPDDVCGIPKVTQEELAGKNDGHELRPGLDEYDPDDDEPYRPWTFSEIAEWVRDNL